MEEIWKDIEGYENLYKVSNTGKIKSVEKCVNFYSGYSKKVCKRKYPEKLLNTPIKKGYKQVGLYKEGKCKWIAVHRIVANAFLENKNKYPCVNHKDENKLNNSVDNLEWCSYLYNNTYNKINVKRGLAQKGKRNAKYNYNGIVMSLPQIAKEMGISYSTLRNKIKSNEILLTSAYL